eukprot:6059149-Pyramimonas_sp.AAC.1
MVPSSGREQGTWQAHWHLGRKVPQRSTCLVLLGGTVVADLSCGVLADPGIRIHQANQVVLAFRAMLLEDLVGLLPPAIS